MGAKDSTRVDTVIAEPELTSGTAGSARRLLLSGDWVVAHAEIMEVLAEDVRESPPAPDVTVDLGQVGRLDTVGALVLHRLCDYARTTEGKVRFEGGRPEQRALISAIVRETEAAKAPVVERPFFVIRWLELIGRGVARLGFEIVRWFAVLGAIVAAAGQLLLHPGRFRGTSFVFHLEHVGFRAVPIIALISFLVGAIVAQQGIFQLRHFGATIFVVDLVGILTLRELGVLLTSIMVAGRSGSAFTAEIGSMKMREEIDALNVMALNPVEVLILPRLLALVVGLTMLSFISEISALVGGGLVVWVYGGVTPEASLARLKEAIDLTSFTVGMVKAPFMAIVIGVIAAIEGLEVEGSAESLGMRTTASVVKSIFMVIVLDGIFAVMFAALGL
jgi:phospholipid/cholesterol/gamma-HCH transport system permease protein